jgi:pyruvate dehydrogenase E2 component (dihydrolipoyllysine-residue acetyltransferase)
MPINITMPALSPTMETGTLALWHVKEGDGVAPGDVIAEIESDKATMEVEAVDEGTIGKIVVPAGTEDVAVNSVIAVLLEEGESAGDLPPSFEAPVQNTSAPQEEAKSDPQVSKPHPEEGATKVAVVSKGKAGEETMTGSHSRVFASPLARRIAKDAGLEISTLTGSGPKGRIIKADVETAIRDGVPAKAAPATGKGASLASGMGSAQVLALYEEGTYEVRPNDGMRTVVAARLTEAKQTVPHFYLNMDCNIDKLLAARAEINASARKDKDGKPEFKLSVNDFILKAWALALQQVPDANATWAGDSILYHKASDVAVAVAVPGGLFTPVVRSAEAKTLKQISIEVRDYAIRAKSKKLAPHEYQGGSSAVSNLGMFGITSFAAVINPPHGTILAIGAGEERVYAQKGEIKSGMFMTVTLSCDHRSVDGALGATALNAFKKMIENPVMMLA